MFIQRLFLLWILGITHAFGSPILTGVALSSTTLIRGSPVRITIEPQPSTAVLPTCTVSTIYGQTPLIGVEQGQLYITPEGLQSTGMISFTVTCGNHQAGFNMLGPLDAIEGHNGQSFSLQAAVPVDIMDTGKTIAIWVAVRLPANHFFFTTDTWFFRTETGWQNGFAGEPDSYRYTLLPNAQSWQRLNIDMGQDTTVASLRGYGMEVYMAYRIAGGPFKILGPVWH